MKKRIISLLLGASLVFSLCSTGFGVNAKADEAENQAMLAAVLAMQAAQNGSGTTAQTGLTQNAASASSAVAATNASTTPATSGTADNEALLAIYYQALAQKNAASAAGNTAANTTGAQGASAVASQGTSSTEALMAAHPTVSKEAWNARYINSTSSLTPDQYVYYMYSDPTFDLKAYMYYNEDLMSKYTYNYWQYYKQYLEKGIMENRIHYFQPDDTYNTVTVGRYQTKYKDNTQRGNNVRLAASSINGTILLPGQEFSFNNVVGQRTAARGYKVAHVYVNKQVVDGIGGGICQVSSTLYVAMMIAGLQATERHVHCLPVDYLKPNLDATINWGTCDLKFINTLGYPIVILASGSPEGILTVNICKYLG